MRLRTAALWVALAALAATLFLVMPQLDLWVSCWFYIPGKGFPLRDWGPVLLVYRAIPWLAWGVAGIVAIATLWLVLMQRPLWRFDRKALLFVAIATLVGPGLLANTLLKDHWGRARPEQVEQFGGTHLFTPAPFPAHECTRNCSFVSGHAALGFALIAFALLFPPGTARTRAIVATLGFGAVVGVVRIAAGGHFLSDVLWAGLIVVGTTVVLYWWIAVEDSLAAPPLLRFYHRLGGAAVAAGDRLRSSEAWRIGTAITATAIMVMLSAAWVDRPVSLYLHARDPDLQALFEWTGSLGEAWGWLVLFALAFTALHWGGTAPALHGAADRLRALSAIPALLFISVAAAGLTVDLLKIGFGRTRPKLLFRGGLYGFDGPAWRPDHWSFPSGHTATIVAVAATLWWLWPRHLLFYICLAAVVAVSRVAVGAHYPSDIVAGAVIAVLTTRAVVLLCARGGIMPARNGGLIADGALPPWPCRAARSLWARRSEITGGRRTRAATEPGGRLPARRGL
jgi:lipid A 4'-phosphatase